MKSKKRLRKKLQSALVLAHQQLTNSWISQSRRLERVGLTIILSSEVVLGTFAVSTAPASAAPVSVNVCFKTGTELDLNQTWNANTKAKLTNSAYFGATGTAAPETFNFKSLTSVTITTLSSNGCQIYLGGGSIQGNGSDDLTSTEISALSTWLQASGHFLLAGCDYAGQTSQICSNYRTMSNIGNGGVSINSLLSYNPLTCGGALTIGTFGGVSSYFTMLAGDQLLGKHNTALQQPAIITDSLVTPKFLFTGDADMYGSSGASAIGAGATASTDQAKFIVNSFKFALDAIMGRLGNPQCFASYDQKADLELSISTSNASPAVGGQTTVTITVVNKGPTNVTGVTAIANLPAGLSLASQTGTGSYSAATQAWSIGSLNNGASATITLTLNVTSAGSLSIPAQITQSSLADIDSSTNVGFGVDDLSDGVADDDEASVVISASLPVYTVTGNVFDDLDGSKIKAASGENYTAASITAVLLDASNKVVSTAAVNATGDYTLNNVPAGTYSVKIIQTPGTALTTGVVIPPANDILPTNWVATGENNNGTPDATVDRTQSVTVASANITNINFGIEQLPNTTALTPASQSNPGGSATVQVSTLEGTDPEDGALGSGKTFKIVTLPTNADLYYDGTKITTPNFVIANYDPTKLLVDPNDGSITVSFTYAAVDAAGQTDPTPATVNIPFSAVYTIAGNVFDDLDGSKIKAASGENYTAANITAVLLNTSNQVISTAAVNATGNYTLNNVSAGTYSVKIIQTPGTALTPGVVIPPANDILPTNWVTTGENNNGTPDATIDRTQSVTVASANITNINFGIEQLPDTTALNPASQNNPSGSTQYTVPTLAGTDPEDGALGSGKTFKIVTLPINGNLYYNGTKITTPNFVITNYDPTKLTVDPNDGAITVSFTYAAVDAADQQDSTPATATMPFTAAVVTPPNLLLVKRITAINGLPLNVYKDDTASTYAADDNNINWPTPLNANTTLGDTTISTFLRGAIDGGKVKPGDTIEYTIYFLNAGGSNANNVRVCDRITDSQKFLDGSSIQLQKNSTTPTALTRVAGDDRATFYASSSDSAITNCNFTSTPTLDNGAIVVDVTGASNPAWTALPGSTGAGTTDTYGFVRFTTKVNP